MWQTAFQSRSGSILASIFGSSAIVVGRRQAAERPIGQAARLPLGRTSGWRGVASVPRFVPIALACVAIVGRTTTFKA